MKLNLENYKLIPFVQLFPLFGLISLLVILSGVFFAYKNSREIGHWLFLGIDFTGGSYIALQLPEPAKSSEIKEIASNYSVGEPVVQVREDNPKEVEIRMNFNTKEAKNEEEASRLRVEKYGKMLDEIGKKFGGRDKIQEVSFDYVGPIVGGELIRNAIWSLVLGSIAIGIYILIRFSRLVFSLGAVIALIHDVLVTLAGTAAFRLEVNAFFIAVILTIIGYSINDTIIIYDRIRENLKNFPQLSFPTIINLSITQTLQRSVNTVLTVIFVLIALLFLGGRSLYDFSLAMLFGMVSGAYSSIFIASPIVLLFSRERRKMKLPSRLNLILAQERAVTGEWEEEEVEAVEEALEKEPVKAPASKASAPQLVETPEAAVPSADTTPTRTQAPSPAPSAKSTVKKKKKAKKARRR